MRIIVNVFNFLSKVILGVGIVDFFNKVSLTKAEAQKADRLARNQQFSNAVRITEEILSAWSPTPSFFERWLRRWELDNLLKRLRRQQQRWQNIVEGKERFHRGLAAEQAGNLDDAARMYKAAAALLPDSTECRIRVGILAIKAEDWTKALAEVKGIVGEQAAYIRGFAYAKQGNLQKAHREWQSLSHDKVQAQRDVLKMIGQRPRLLAKREIEQLLETDNLEAVKAKSEAFIQKFGPDQRVQANLDQHILPRLNVAAWKSQDWKKVVETAKQIWSKQQDITSLHNWAVASYYCALEDSSSLTYLIVVWSTALANIHLNPSLQDVPWLGSTTINFNDLSLNLKQLIEDAIDAVKDRDINEYFQLRDYYRLEFAALRLMGNPTLRGMRLKDLFLTPGFYELHCANLPEALLYKDPNQDPEEAKLLAALYTNWGLAVAVCLEGDTNRAIQIKPATHPLSEAERYAQQLVSYHEGCYYLQHHRWHQAVTPLKQAQAEIKASVPWHQEVDRLCQVQRQVISTEDEHLDFARFWYDFLGSQSAGSYLAEYRAEQIREKLAKEEITFGKALKDLQKLQQIDAQNPFVIDLIAMVESSQELQEIDKSLKSNRFDEAVRQAKNSRHQRVRQFVAEICINILIEILKREGLDENDYTTIMQLGFWANELCPDESPFQEVLRQLGLQ
ncbi:MAG: peptidase M, neutral zinc metallopeptidase site [Xenococcaceae cyanobacterium]